MVQRLVSEKGVEYAHTHSNTQDGCNECGTASNTESRIWKPCPQAYPATFVFRVLSVACGLRSDKVPLFLKKPELLISSTLALQCPI